MIAFVCPHCAKGLKTKDELAGRKVKCPGCGKALAVPPTATGAACQTELKSAAAQENGISAPAASVVARDHTVQETGVEDGHESKSDRSGETAQWHDGKRDVPRSKPAQGANNELWDFLAPPERPDEIGRLGPYRVLKVLGAGGMGVVFRAEDPHLERIVALKAMLPAQASSASARTRFFREAKAAAALKHPNIVTIFQIGEDRGAPFLAMEFLEGECLDETIKRQGKLASAEVLRIGREIAEGLACAHEKGLIHRDIKPANIWLEGSKRHVKILDFGLARALADQTHLTQSGAIIGTPAYMAPEQAEGLAVDHRCDLFSLGCVLYRMSTGEMPFKGNTTLAILLALSQTTPPPPLSRNLELPAQLSDLVMRLLAKKPEDRPESAAFAAASIAEMEQALAHDSSGTKIGQPALKTDARTRQKKEPVAATARVSKPSHTRRPWWAAASLLAVGLIVAAATVLFRVRTEEGEFLIETDDDQVAVAIDKQGGVLLIDRASKKEYWVHARKAQQLPASEYELAVTDEAAGLKFESRTFSITRNGRKVKAWFEKAGRPIADPQTPLIVQRQEPAKDSRLGKPKDLNGYFPFTPPTSKEAWSRRRQQLGDQVLVANGLWPMPTKAPLTAVIHGKIARDGYTVEKVFFASYPGHYVTGNLYRPTNPAKRGKYAGVLSPHGHWANGRFHDAGDAEAKSQIANGAEKTFEGARYPLQARCANLARMGCVVFHYDMVGMADSKQIPHATGFADREAELRLQSFMGLQTYNSIRALDFLSSLPEVDPGRIGVTGASGGGTQTLVLCAVDERPAAAFAAGMVSTGMQGGCVCENCSYLRVGTGNVELAGLFAPRPLGMSAARDWTQEIETKGLPELKALYRLYGAEDRVAAKAFLQFDHNYNQVSREMMYNFFNKHLQLEQPQPLVERSFVPVPPQELSVFDAGHPLPRDAVDVHGLRNYLTRESERQIAALLPTDAGKLAEFRRVLGTALRVMISDGLPERGDIAIASTTAENKDGILVDTAIVGRKDSGERVRTALARKSNQAGPTVVWVHPRGLASLWSDKGKLVTPAQMILDSGRSILAVEVFHTGSSAAAPPLPINNDYAGFTFGYNRSLLANRVHDILTAVALARSEKNGQVDLIGFEEAGPWVALARGLCGDAVKRTAADLHQFRFEDILNINDDMMLPGALKYGGMPALTALAAPHELFLHNAGKVLSDSLCRKAFAAAGHPDNLQWRQEKMAPEQVVAWLGGTPPTALQTPALAETLAALSNEKPQREFKGHTGGVWHADLSADGRLAVSAGGGFFRDGQAKPGNR